MQEVCHAELSSERGPGATSGEVKVCRPVCEISPGSLRSGAPQLYLVRLNQQSLEHASGWSLVTCGRRKSCETVLQKACNPLFSAASHSLNIIQCLNIMHRVLNNSM